MDGRDFLEGPEPLTGTIRARLVFDQYLAERTAFLEHRTLLKAALTAIAGSITDDSRLFFSMSYLMPRKPIGIVHVLVYDATEMTGS